MKRIFWHWIISALALLLAAYVVPGVKITHWYDVIWIAPLLGLVNMVVGLLTWIISLLALPITLVTLGCFSFVVSFFLYVFSLYYLFFSKTGSFSHYMSYVGTGSGWGAAVLFAVVMALFSSVLNMVLPGKDARRR